MTDETNNPHEVSTLWATGRAADRILDLLERLLDNQQPPAPVIEHTPAREVAIELLRDCVNGTVPVVERDMLAGPDDNAE